MARTLILCALLIVLPIAGRADEGPRADRTVVRMNVQAMPAPKPALRIQLLPQLKEMSPGNPIQGYMKCFMEQQNFFYGKSALDNREKWATMPLKDLPLKELRDHGKFALSQADTAARLDRPDWQVLPALRKDGVTTILPDLHPMRRLALALQVRFRAQVAERRFDAALVTARTMFALARHLDQHPTPIGNLVGLSVAHLALGPLEEMLQQSGCPNLYWALTNLPRPLVGFRNGLQGEPVTFLGEFSRFDVSTPLDEAGLARVAERLQVMREVGAPGSAKMDVRAWLARRAGDPAIVRAARARLVAAGLDEARLKKLLAAQLILLDEKRAFEERRDEGARWLAMPYWQAETARKAEKPDGGTLFAALRTSWAKMHRNQARLEQRIALLRHVEAIRLYAAAHEGKLPARLSDVPVPLPVDPFTGKAVLYKVEGKRAILTGTPPRAEEKNPLFNVQYEVAVTR
jgi:hypothetical protein